MYYVGGERYTKTFIKRSEGLPIKLTREQVLLALAQPLPRFYLAEAFVASLQARMQAVRDIMSIRFCTDEQKRVMNELLDNLPKSIADERCFK